MRRLIAVLAVAVTAQVSGAQLSTNWVAFHDHNATTATAPNVGRLLLRVPGGPVNMTNFGSGVMLPSTLQVTTVGTPDDFGTSSYPDPGTPAYNLFNGIVDVGNANSMIGVRNSSGSSTTLIFSNLDSGKRYVFRGTAVRGGNYPLRWTVASLQGVASFVNAHTPGVVTIDTLPTATLTNGQAAWNSGNNKPTGDLVGWDDIAPGDDGVFAINCIQYTGPIPSGTATSADYGYAINAFMLAEVGEPSPLEVTTQPPDTTVEQFRTITLTVGVTGSSPAYQWYKGGQLLTGETKRTLTITNAALENSGEYFVIANGPLNSVTSRTAVVTVYADTTAPTITYAAATAAFTNVYLQFSEVMDSVILLDNTTYTITDGINQIYVISATIAADGRTVTLELDPSTPFAENTLYTLSFMSQPTDLGQNALVATSVSFRSWVRVANGGLIFEVYDTTGTSGSGVQVLRNDTDFPNNPRERHMLTIMDTRQVYTDDSHEEYGARIRGLFFPDKTGPWRFFSVSDDASELWLNPNGISESGKQLIASETACCGAFEPYGASETSAAIPLEAGKGYYIEALYKEGTGGDYFKLAARLDGEPIPARGAVASIDPAAVPAYLLGIPAIPAGIDTSVSILTQPQSVTTEANTPVTLTVVATNQVFSNLLYQWQRSDDGGATWIDVPGARTPTLNIPWSSVSDDNGDKYQVVVTGYASNTVVSAQATLTVNPDTVRPKVTRVLGISPTLVAVFFSEPMHPETIDPLNFELDNARYVSTATVSSNNPLRIDLAISAQEPLVMGTEYTLTINGLTDKGNLPLDPEPPVVKFLAQYFEGNPDNIVELPAVSMLPLQMAPPLRGFDGRFFQVSLAVGASNEAAIAMIDGKLLQTNGLPYPNLAPMPYFVETNILNYTNGGGGVGHFLDDTDFPGYTTTNDNNYMATEIIAFVELRQGLNRIGVNSDDGFRLDLVNTNDFRTSVFKIAEFNGGRGAADTITDLMVTQSGLYAMRLIWIESSGGAALEFFVIDPMTGTPVAINGSDSFRAFRVWETTPSLTATMANGNITLSWPVSSVGMGLEVSPAIGSPWTYATPIVTTDDKFTFTAPADGTSKFFRLMRKGN